jgi:putative tryptophan/tyrosine transport system substrate-binding protein
VIGRRELLSRGAAGALALTAAPLTAWGQPRLPLIAYLSPESPGSATAPEGFWPHFGEAMTRLGYRAGSNVEFAGRYADGFLDRLPALAEEIVALKPNVIVVATGPAILAAWRATRTIPIVFVSSPDTDVLRSQDVIESQARPGGNVTGVTNVISGMLGKHVQFATEIMPAAQRMGMLLGVSNPNFVHHLREAEEACGKLGLTLVTAEVRDPTEIEAAVGRLASQRVDFVYPHPDPIFYTWRRRIVENADASNLPVFGTLTEWAEAGAVFGYGVSLTENYRRAAYYADRILKGSKPGDLPIEFPTRFEMTINLKSARKFGLTIPQAVMIFATEVIE